MSSFFEVQKHKDNLRIRSLRWPGNSPDMNPIENLWHYMGKQIWNRRPTTIAELKLVIEDVCYNQIDTIYIKKTVQLNDQKSKWCDKKKRWFYQILTLNFIKIVIVKLKGNKFFFQTI